VCVCVCVCLLIFVFKKKGPHVFAADYVRLYLFDRRVNELWTAISRNEAKTSIR